MGSRIPRRERLHRYEEIRAVRQRGVCIRGKFLTLYIARAPNYRIGVIAGRRVGIAVKRNRARRVLREAVRAMRSRLRADRPAEILLSARARAAEAKTPEIAKELEALFIAQGLLG